MKKYFNWKSIKVQHWTPLEVILNEFCLWITVCCMQRSRKWVLPHWIRLYLPPLQQPSLSSALHWRITLHTFFAQEQIELYTAKLLFHQSPTRHSDYTVTTTVTMWSLFSSPWHCDYLTVTTSDTNVIRYPLPWGLYRNLSTRHLVGNSTVTTWEDTRYPLHTVTVQESRWHRYTVL